MGRPSPSLTISSVAVCVAVNSTVRTTRVSACVIPGRAIPARSAPRPSRTARVANNPWRSWGKVDGGRPVSIPCPHVITIVRSPLNVAPKVSKPFTYFQILFFFSITAFSRYFRTYRLFILPVHTKITHLISLSISIPTATLPILPIDTFKCI